MVRRRLGGGRRAGRRFDADLGVTTDALLFLGELDPDAIGPALEFATHYEPTPVADVERLLDAVPLDPQGATFVDLGSGMGRVVLLAARRPFRQVVGVEVSPALHEVARENLKRGVDPLRRCRDIRLRCADAATFRFPPGPLVVFLFNPFSAPLLERVMANLARHRAEQTIVYHTPLHRDVVEAAPEYRTVERFSNAVIYARAGDSRAVAR